ncbi:ferric-chelate reductase [Phlyctema vagabunda]|uniref:Ferric-chelate reductase n=1 Tax=Phlyctema vagabunda TaxID=108571 RepID=A0ABR4PI47_9HELO
MRSSFGILGILLPLPKCLAFIGLGIEMYNPSCAFACRAVVASFPLECSTHEMSSGDHMGHGGMAMTTPECRASDTPFLTTLAWCMNSTCTDFGIEAWKLEKYWAEQSTGAIKTLPKWTYLEALMEVTEIPQQEVSEDGTLNFTAAVSRESWSAERMSMVRFEEQETLHSRYGLVLLVVGFGTPILVTLLSYLPYMTCFSAKMKSYLIYPSTIGTYHTRPLPYLLGNSPTIGQSLYIVMFFTINIFMAAIGYRSIKPNTWFETRWQEIMAYVSARTGVLAFALAPLVILFSGRNNFLLWLTNWSHSTYMLLHRWVARMFGLQVILHSIIELVLYIDMGSFKEETKLPYWIWGIVATLITCIMLVVSSLYFRRLSYEVFLISHIIMAVFVLVGSWYHVEYRFARKWGYEIWLYAAFAVWFFDRIVRVLRIAKVGIRQAKVTEVSSDTVRVDIKGVTWAATPGRHAYVYFPALSPFKPWENHPFSIIPTSMLLSRNHSISQKEEKRGEVLQNRDLEKIGNTISEREVSQSFTTAGVSLYIKKSSGITQLLRTNDQMKALMDGPYSNNNPDAVLRCDRLLLVGGGIGITGLLAFINCHPNVKLCWSVKQNAEGLVRDLDLLLYGLKEKEILIERRLDIDKLLEQELHSGWNKIGVVVCGPGGLCDDVRAAVVRVGRETKTVFELEVEAFSW